MNFGQPAPDVARAVAVEIVDHHPDGTPCGEDDHRLKRQVDEQEDAACDCCGANKPERWGAETARAVWFNLAEHHHRNRDHHERVKRARVGNIGKLANGEECRGKGNHAASDRGDDIGRFPFGVDF